MLAALRGRPVGAVVIALAALLVADAAALAAHDERPSAETLLRRAARFPTAQRTAAFAGTLRIEAHETGKGGGRAGGSFVQRLRLEGTARFPDASRFRARTGDGVTEVVLVAGRTYVRDAGTETALATQKWAVFDRSAADERAGVRRQDGSGPEQLGDALDVQRVLRAAHDAVVVGRGARGAYLVRAVVTPRLAFGDLGAQVRKASIELTAAPSGRIDRSVVRVVAQDADVEADYAFRDWGEPVEIVAPPAELIDTTPDLDEDAVLAFHDAPLLQPVALPRGWSLTGAGIVDAGDSAEGCTQVELDYDDPGEPDAGAYLTLYEIPSSCAGIGGPPDGAQPFRAAGRTGWVHVDPEEGTYAQVAIGATTVQAETTLSPGDLARVLVQLVPFDFARGYEVTAGVTGRQRST